MNAGQTPKLYRVEWSIEWPAKGPREAAEDVFDTFFRGDHTATAFAVTGDDGSQFSIDLQIDAEDEDEDEDQD